MCSNSSKIENEINDLVALVKQLQPDSITKEGFVEVEEKISAPVSQPQSIYSEPTQNAFQRIFSFSGTTKRLKFAKGLLAKIIITSILVYIDRIRLLQPEWVLILSGMICWSLFSSLIKRWRDTGYKLRWLATLVVPYVQIITMLFVFFAPSKRQL